MFVCVRSTVCGWMDMSIPVEMTGLFTAVTVFFHHVVHKNQTLTVRLANNTFTREMSCQPNIIFLNTLLIFSGYTMASGKYGHNSCHWGKKS